MYRYAALPDQSATSVVSPALRSLGTTTTNESKRWQVTAGGVPVVKCPFTHVPDSLPRHRPPPGVAQRLRTEADVGAGIHLRAVVFKGRLPAHPRRLNLGPLVPLQPTRVNGSDGLRR